MAIHVDASRVNPKDENYLVIENITPDVYSTLGIVPQYTLRKFVVSGLLCEQRGLRALYQFASRYPQVAFVAAGNVTDHIGQKFVDLENVDYYGYIPQEKLLILSASAAGVFSLYDPSVEINRLAASNKLYDAMMMGLTVITNKGIAASDFVDENRIGVVLPFDFCDQWSCLPLRI